MGEELNEMSEEEKKEMISDILTQIKNSIKQDKLETLENLSKILEQLKNENEKFQVLTKLVEKIRNKKDLSGKAIYKFISYNFENYVFDYIKEFTEIADSVYFLYFSDKILIDFEIKITQDIYETFARAELLHTMATNQDIIIFSKVNVKENIEKITEALISLILDIKRTIQYYEES